MYFVEENFLYEDRCTHPRKPLASSSILPLDRQGLSAATSRYHQCRLEAVVSETRLTHHLGSVIVDMNRHRHHATANVDSVTTSPIRLGSAIGSITWQWHHATVNVASMAPSPEWPSGDITSWPILPRQHHHQHDSGTQYVLPWLAIRLRGSPPIRLGGLRSITPRDSLTQVHFYLHQRSQLEASASSPQLLWGSSPN
jgi:hypothetical protein